MLSEQQLTQFEKQGYLLLPGLIPEETVTKAAAAMWRMMGMAAENPDSWGHFKRPHLAGFYMEKLGNGKRIELFGVTHPDVLACCTPDYRAVLKQLASRYPEIPHCESQQPDGIWALNQFPVSGEWKSPSPHLDGDFRDFRLDPGTFRATSLTYLTDANSHSGTTVIWPEGPQRIREFRKKNPEFSNHVGDMKARFPEMDLGEPMEVVAKQGRCAIFPPSLAAFRHNECGKFCPFRNPIYVFMSLMSQMGEKRGVEHLDALMEGRKMIQTESQTTSLLVAAIKSCGVVPHLMLTITVVLSLTFLKAPPCIKRSSYRPDLSNSLSVIHPTTGKRLVETFRSGRTPSKPTNRHSLS